MIITHYAQLKSQDYLNGFKIMEQGVSPGQACMDLAIVEALKGLLSMQGNSLHDSSHIHTYAHLWKNYPQRYIKYGILTEPQKVNIDK